MTTKTTTTKKNLKVVAGKKSTVKSTPVKASSTSFAVPISSDSAVKVAEQLKNLGIIKAYELLGPNQWVWLKDTGKPFVKWYKEKMALEFPIFRVFFQYSGKRHAWYARTKGGIEILNDAKHWGLMIKEDRILNSHASQEIKDQAKLRCAGKDNSWPGIKEAKKEKSETPSADMGLSEAVKLLRKAGYKIVEEK